MYNFEVPDDEADMVDNMRVRWAELCEKAKVRRARALPPPPSQTFPFATAVPSLQLRPCCAVPSPPSHDRPYDDRPRTVMSGLPRLARRRCATARWAR